MARIDMSVLDTDYVRVQWKATENGVPVDPTGYTAKMAFLPSGVNPTTGDWHTATWETVSGKYYARVLVGPGGVPLATGRYRIWSTLSASPETPVKDPDFLVIY